MQDHDRDHRTPEVTPHQCINPSTIGPSVSAGKIIRPAVSAITPTSRTTNVPPSVRKVPADSGTVFLRRERPAEGERGEQRHEPAEQHRDRAEVGREVRCAVAGERAAVVVALRVVRVQRLAEAVDAGVVDRCEAALGHDRERGEDQHHRRHEQSAERGELDLARLDLLAQPLRRTTDHQPSHEHRDDDVEEHPVEAGADPAEDHLAGEHVHDRHRATVRSESVVASCHRAVGRIRRRDRPQRCVGDAVANLLVGHVAAALAVSLDDVHAGVAQHLRAVLLGGQRHRHADDEHREHSGEHHGGVPARTHHPPEHEDLARRNKQDRQHLEEVGQTVRVLERHGRVRVVEAAAVRPELLDRDLRRSRPARDRLLRALERRRRRMPVEGLDDTLRDQDHRQDDRERQQDVDAGAVEVLPEVADLAARAAGDAAHDGSENGHADGGGDEVLHRQPRHLAQVRHRVLAAVVLPVRVRDEAGRSVQRDVGRDAGEIVGIEEQVTLHALEHVEQQRRTGR